MHDGRHLMPQEDPTTVLSDRDRAVLAGLNRWAQETVAGVRRIADDLKRGACPGCGAPAFDGRDGAFCNDDCRSVVIMAGAVEGEDASC